jgi:hypothetical protein
MRTALRTKGPKTQVVVGRSIPAPVGGWDALNPLAAMPPINAVILDNIIPRAGYVELRRGYLPHVSTAAPVETLMSFRSGVNDDLFAASGGGIYDVSAAGVPPVLMLGGLTSNRFNYTAWSNAAGAWIVACNGVNAPIGYNAGVWAAVPALSGAGPPVLVPTTLFNVFAHKARLYYLEANSLRVWNPAAGAVGGACTLLDLAPIFSKGGRLVCGANWSAQLAVTADDYAVFVTDQGQVAIYQGIDPTVAASFTLVGVYDFGPPLGPQSLVKFGGDLALATVDGIIPLSQGLTLDRTQQGNVAMTRQIMQAFSEAARAYFNQIGWQGILTTFGGPTSPQGSSLAIFNVPTATNATAVQFVQNAMTGAWCRFTGWNSLCWEMANSNVYFGHVDGVMQAGIGSSDNGAAIIGDVLGAFSSYGSGAQIKRFISIRPVMNTIPQVKPALEVNVDFQQTAPVAVPTVVSSGAAAAEIRFDWTGASGVGYVGAPRMRISLLGDTDVALLDVGDIPPHYLGIDAGDPTAGLLISTGLPFDVPCQLLSFDLMYETGGQL